VFWSYFIHLRILNARAFALAFKHSCVYKMLSRITTIKGRELKAALREKGCAILPNFMDMDNNFDLNLKENKPPLTNRTTKLEIFASTNYYLCTLRET
jgi:hypothetical protein